LVKERTMNTYTLLIDDKPVTVFRAKGDTADNVEVAKAAWLWRMNGKEAFLRLATIPEQAAWRASEGWRRYLKRLLHRLGVFDLDGHHHLLIGPEDMPDIRAPKPQRAPDTPKP
jgi:hypothetical protein